MKRIVLSVLLLAVCLSFAFAADYYIKNYDVKITVGNDAVHHIEETLDLYFEGPHHGIVREIPLDYRDYNENIVARVRNLTCSDDYETNTDNGYLVMKIGSAEKTLRGDVRYVISYDYDLGADYNEGYDLFYVNIIGTNWECPIESVTFSVKLPYVENEAFGSAKGFSDYVTKHTYFTSGSYGSTRGVEEATLESLSNGDVLIEGKTSGLRSYEGVTIKIDLPDNWYSGARIPWDYRPVMKTVAPIVSILVVVLAAVLWLVLGKDPTPIIVARFQAPDGFSPLQVGYVADYSVDDKDVISMLFYWADQGLLSIEEKKGGKYEFTKLNEIMDYAVKSGRNVPDFERTLFNGFFKGCSIGDKVTFKDLEKNNFYETIQKTKASTRAFFTKSKALTDTKSKVVSVLVMMLSFIPLVMGTLRIGLYENNDGAFLFYLVACVGLFFLNLFLFTTLFSKWYVRKSNFFAILFRILVPAAAVVILCMLEGFFSNGNIAVVQNIITVAASSAVAIFGAATERRSKYGNRIFEEILGYREFIDKVEIDQLKMMIKDDPDLYYRVLSFAVVLGLEDKWAKKFDGMIVNPPVWYTGYSAFDVYCMSRMANRMNRSIPLASIPKSSISGSPGSRIGGGGFGSSGFSGGGFGGGGGHAW